MIATSLENNYSLYNEIMLCKSLTKFDQLFYEITMKCDILRL
jgi:hypothetical protein